MASARAGSEGLVPLYNFMLAFVDDGVQQTTIGEFLDENGINSWQDFGGGEYVEESLLAVVGFLVCVTVGILFIIVFPIIGCCYCCCRTCCGCCQPQKDIHKCVREGGVSSCKRYGCSVALGIMAIFMLSAVVCSFVVTKKVQDEVGGNTVSDASTALNTINVYLQDTNDDIYQGVFPPFDDTSAKVLETLYGLPAIAESKLAKETGIDPALYILLNYTMDLPQLADDLDDVTPRAELLQTDSVDLEADLSTIRGNIDGILDDCGDPCSGSITDNLGKLTPSTDYMDIEDFSGYSAPIRAAIDSGIIGDVEELVESYNQISQAVANETNKTVGEVEQEISAARGELLSYYQELDNFTTDVNKEVNEVIEYLDDDLQPELEKYAPVVFAPFYFFTTICLIITLLILIGLPIGYLGSQGAGHGSRMLLAAVSLTFIFGCLFMLLTTMFFAVGGFTEAMFCRHLRTFDESAEKIAAISRNDFDITYNLTVKELIDSCKANEAFYTAANIQENGVDISELLDINGSAVQEALVAIMKTPIDLPNVTVITQEVIDAINTLAGATADIPYDTVYADTSLPVTQYDLTKYADELDEAADLVGDSTTEDMMRGYAKDLRSVSDGLVADMEEEIRQLNASTKAAEAVTTVDLVTVIGNLSTAQDTINDESETIVGSIINDTCISVYTDLDGFSRDLVHSIEEDIGRCKPVYDASNLAVQSACAYFLHPFNAMWFTYGWFLAFASIAIWLATSMIGIFRIDVVMSKVAPSPEDEDLVLRPLSKAPSYSLHDPMKSYTSLEGAGNMGGTSTSFMYAGGQPDKIAMASPLYPPLQSPAPSKPGVATPMQQASYGGTPAPASYGGTPSQTPVGKITPVEPAADY